MSRANVEAKRHRQNAPLATRSRASREFTTDTDYSNEKGNALAKLAKLIDLIVAGPSDGSNVVRMGEAVP